MINEDMKMFQVNSLNSNNLNHPLQYHYVYCLKFFNIYIDLHHFPIIILLNFLKYQNACLTCSIQI